MSELPTLQQVKQDLAKESGYASWQGYKDCWRGVIVDQAIEAIAKTYTRRVLSHLLLIEENHSGCMVVRSEDIIKIKNELQ